MGLSNIKKMVRKTLGSMYVNNHEILNSSIKQISTYKSVPNLVFLIPPTTAGSLGDEAMIVGAYTRLVSDGKKVVIVSGDINGNERLKLYGIAPDEVGVKGLYDGFLGIKRFHDVLINYQPESVYLIGADVMDGFYSKVRSINRLTILKLASTYCNDARLLGFSFNAEPETEVLDFFQKCSGAFKIQPRDPVSSARLSAHQIANRCVADLAFLLTPDESLVSGFADKKYICINLNAIHLNKWGKEFFDLSVGMVEHLFRNTQYNLVFISHDFRKFDGVSDCDFAKLVTEKLEIQNSDRITFIDELASAAQLKGIAKGAFFVLTGRMHFAIAALGNAIPTIMIGYQGKQEGLAQHFGLDVSKTVISPTASLAESVAIINYTEQNRDSLYSALSEKLPNVKELSYSNIK